MLGWGVGRLQGPSQGKSLVTLALVDVGARSARRVWGLCQGVQVLAVGQRGGEQGGRGFQSKCKLSCVCKGDCACVCMHVHVLACVYVPSVQCCVAGSCMAVLQHADPRGQCGPCGPCWEQPLNIPADVQEME
jgi:hypothetical protein